MSQNTQQTKVLSNDQVQVTITEKPGCLVKFEIHLAPKGTQDSYREAAKIVNKSVSIPGYRKGKTPESILEKNFASFIEKEWKDVLLNTGFREALKLSNLTPFSQDSIKSASIQKASKEEGSSLVIEFESKPEIPNIEMTSIEIVQPPGTMITEKDVNDTIENIRQFHAAWEDLPEKSIEEGDFVDLDIVALEENQEKSICENTRFEVAKGKMGGWMRALVLGKKPGDVVEGVSEKEPEPECQSCATGEEGHHHHHEHSDEEFKPTHCRITVRTIKKATLPEIDNELAKKVGVQTVEEMREKIEQSLRSRAEEDSKDALRASIEEQLLEKYPFEIPKSLIQQEVKEKTRTRVAEIRKTQEEAVSPEQKAEIENEVISELSQIYRLFFLTQKIAHQYQISVSDDEIATETMMMMWKNQTMQNATSQNVEELRSRAHLNVLSRKVLDFVALKGKKMHGE